MTDGSVACWGYDGDRRATPPAGDPSAPGGATLAGCGGTAPACWGDDAGHAAGEFASVSAGWSHTCGVRRDGSVACWGYDGDRRATPPAGEPEATQEVEPERTEESGSSIPKLAGSGDAGTAIVEFASVSAGGANLVGHTCGVQRDGSVACYGGKLARPRRRLGSSPPSAYDTCGVQRDGSVACWGNDYEGQATPPAGEFDSVSAGGYHTCGVQREGSVACWGWDYEGQATPPAGEFASVSAGRWHTCGVQRDGSVACWGADYAGDATPPAGEFASVSAGEVHTCGVQRDGSVACWGSNNSGEATPPSDLE